MTEVMNSNEVSTTPHLGVYAILPTPFDDQGALDEHSLRKSIDFSIEGGADGVAASMNGGEFYTLSELERRRMTEVLADQVAGRVPVIVGVTAGSTRLAVELAAHAKQAGADAIIAMPPHVRHPSGAGIIDFYKSIADASNLPVWIQNFFPPMGTPMSAELVARVLREVPGVGFVKEETFNSLQMISSIQDLAGSDLQGIMGATGRTAVEEFQRGTCGQMVVCEFIEEHVAIWRALREGNEAEARRILRFLLPLLNLEAMYLTAISKEVLRRKGIYSTAISRAPDVTTLDAHGIRELNALLEDLEKCRQTAHAH